MVERAREASVSEALDSWASWAQTSGLSDATALSVTVFDDDPDENGFCDVRIEGMDEGPQFALPLHVLEPLYDIDGRVSVGRLRAAVGA
ncbi:hypothetical protein BH09ACT11_BH09ACT11_07530 [soil metagenome]